MLPVSSENLIPSRRPNDGSRNTVGSQSEILNAKTGDKRPDHTQYLTGVASRRARPRRIAGASPIAEMSPGRKPRYRKSNSELLAGSNLGKNGRFFDDPDVVQLLREAVDREGSISAFAKRAGLHRVVVNSILNGRRPVSRPVVKALGLRKVYVAE